MVRVCEPALVSVPAPVIAIAVVTGNAPFSMKVTLAPNSRRYCVAGKFPVPRLPCRLPARRWSGR